MYVCKLCAHRARKRDAPARRARRVARAARAASSDENHNHPDAQHAECAHNICAPWAAGMNMLQTRGCQKTAAQSGSIRAVWAKSNGQEDFTLRSLCTARKRTQVCVQHIHMNSM